jgi:outer membrane protein TolC
MIILQAISLPLAQPDQMNTMYDLYSFVKTGSDRDPRVKEKQFDINKAKLIRTAIRNSAIFPKLEISSAIGPAPAYTIRQNASGQSVEEFDFTTIGPVIGAEVKVLQPLNIRRLNDGLAAADYNTQISELDAAKSKIEMNLYLQEIYFKYLYANQMVLFARDIRKNFDKAINAIKDSLDDDNPKVSQNDLFELKSFLFKIDDGLYQAEYVKDAARLAISFSLGRDHFLLHDTLINIREDSIPNIDILNFLLSKYHPDLKKLAKGIKAQEKLVKVAKGELYPDAFIAGSFKISKAWNDKDNNSNSDEDLLSPFNKKEGTFGFGVRYNLNFWSLRDKYIKENLSLQQLQYKQSYAQKGLLLELNNQYQKVLLNKKRLLSAEVSSVATASWLKSAALKYDLDPTELQMLLKAYEKNIQAQKDYYECILDYDVSVGELIAKTGLTLEEYRENLEH